MTNRQRAIRKDARILRRFTELYCRERHETKRGLAPISSFEIGACPHFASEMRPFRIRRLFAGDSSIVNCKSSILCPDCRRLLAYSIGRRRSCPLDPKPACGACRIHCYAQPYRDEIRQAMRIGARHYVSHGWLDGLIRRLKNLLTPNKKGKSR
jgi:hypothetical protein